MSSHLIDSLATTDALSEIFSDRSLLSAMLAFEVALARVEAAEGVIPSGAADAIASVDLEGFDAAEIARAARRSGTVTIGFVKALTDSVARADSSSACFVHFGATSQDVADTAMVLTLQRARQALDVDRERLARSLRRLSDRHARTVMLARTLLQPAAPTTFGLKVAGWAAALTRGWHRIEAAFDDALVLQFGGAAGTLAALDDRGPAVSRALAGHLQLALPDASWHPHRDRLAAVLCACGVYTATLGKVARDISLLMQDEVGEVFEPGGGSSTMPHKRNPAGCAIVLAAANRVPGLVSSFLAGMVQEHERAVGGWHAEWPTIAHAVQATGAALAAMADVADDLSVDEARMRANIERTNGVIFAERAIMLLTPPLGKGAAKELVERALERTRQDRVSFREALKALPEVVKALPASVLDTIDVPEHYLGAAETLRVQLLASD